MPSMASSLTGAPPEDIVCAGCKATDIPLLACDDFEDNGDAVKRNPAERPRFCANCMIGKKVRVFWPVDNSWYLGTVQQYDENTGEHLLKYDDDDTEWVKIGETNTTAQPDENPPGSDPPPGGHHRDPMMAHHPSGMHNVGDPRVPPGYPSHHGYHPSNGSPYPGGYPPHPSPPPPHHPGYHYPPTSGMHQYDPALPVRPESSPSGSKRKSGPKAWTKEEDSLLLGIVQSMRMPLKWSVVAQHLPDRTGKQCRERYVNHLNPRLKVSDWTPVEDAMIFHLYNTMGSHWAKMSKMIPGRTDNGIKNRFHNLRRQLEREDEHRLKLQAPRDYPEELRLDSLRELPPELLGKSAELWDINQGLGVLAAQSVGGPSVSRNTGKFGPFRTAEAGDQCVRCGFLLPSQQTGDEVCTKTGWCLSCTRMPPHVSGPVLRECLRLRRCHAGENRKIIESWEDGYPKDAAKQ